MQANRQKGKHKHILSHYITSHHIILLYIPLHYLDLERGRSCLLRGGKLDIRWTGTEAETGARSCGTGAEAGHSYGIVQ